MHKVENLIIGAGPAGLAVAGRMRHKNIPFEILEQTLHIGSSWRNHYDRLHLHTVKQLSSLPHLPFPKEYALYVSREQVVIYLENYAQHFNIQPHFGVEVTNISRKNTRWLVQTNSEQMFLANRVIVASGVNRVPNIPKWKGQELFGGEILHTKFYKNPQPYKGKKVLIIGMGNTGAEIALDLAEHYVDTTLSVRSPITIVPRDLNGRPVQLTAKKLAKIPFGLGTWLGTQIRRFYIGDLSQYGVPLSNADPATQLRETGKTPVIDIGTVQAIKEGFIQVIGDIKHFHKTGIITIKDVEYDFDTVLLATGYKAQLQDFVQNIDPFLDKHHLPSSPVGKGVFKDLFFIGFDNYKLGGILGTIQTDSKTIVDTIKV